MEIEPSILGVRRPKCAIIAEIGYRTRRKRLTLTEGISMKEVLAKLNRTQR